MRILFLYLIILASFISCASQKTTSEPDREVAFEKNDDGEYDIIVFDGGYDLFLNTIAKPKEFYSENYYKTKNVRYVTEWNSRHAQPMKYDPNIYEVRINYRPHIEYGYEFEYKLFNFFKFIEWKDNVNLESRN